MKAVFLTLSLIAAAGQAMALEVQKIDDGIYAFVGDLGQRSPENLGNNATFGAIVTSGGVVLVDSGGSRAGAIEIEKALKTVTDKPVVAVVNTGGQDHRWLGNGYWKQKGARIIASKDAVADQRARADQQIAAMREMIGAENFAGTVPVFADEPFPYAYDFMLGGVAVQLRHLGTAHTPGDSFIWLPQRLVVFSGDIVYVERMLGVGEQSNAKKWLEGFEAIARFKPDHIIPGHGHATTVEQATAETYDYLVHLRTEIRTVLDNGGGIEQAVEIDQSAFAHLKAADQIARRNAQQVFVEMEFE